METAAVQTSGSSVSFATVWLAAQLHRQLQTQQQAPQGTVVIWLAGSVSTGHKGSSVAEQVAGADEPLATIGQPSEPTASPPAGAGMAAYAAAAAVAHHQLWQQH